MEWGFVKVGMDGGGVCGGMRLRRGGGVGRGLRMVSELLVLVSYRIGCTGNDPGHWLRLLSAICCLLSDLLLIVARRNADQVEFVYAWADVEMRETDDVAKLLTERKSYFSGLALRLHLLILDILL